MYTRKYALAGALFAAGLMASTAMAQEVLSGGGGSSSGGPITSPLGTQAQSAAVAINPATGATFSITGPTAGLSVNDNAQYNSTAPTLTSGGTGSLQLDVNGNLKTALPTGAAKDSSLATIISQQAFTAAGTTATSGQGVQGMTGGVPLPVSSPAQYNSTTPTLASGASTLLQTDNGGNLKVVLQPSTAQIGNVNAGVYNPNLESYTVLGFDPIHVDNRGNAKTAETGSSDPLVGITPTVTQSGTSVLGKATPGNLYGTYAVNTTATAGYLVTVNATAVPAAGATITPQDVVPIPANGTAALNFSAGPPDAFSTGVVVLLTTSLTTYTAGPSGFMQTRVR